jgi:hypothetical protein
MNQLQTKRNPWPIVIISYFVVFITFIVVFVIFAARQRTDLVRQDYYDEEIRFQQQIDRVSRTRPISAEVGVTYDSSRQLITITLPVAQANRQPAGKILLYRPSDARLDRNIRLAVDEKGSQLVDTKKLRAGLWKVRVEWSVDGHEFFFDKSIVVNFRA